VVVQRIVGAAGVVRCSGVRRNGRMRKMSLVDRCSSWSLAREHTCRERVGSRSHGVDGDCNGFRSWSKPCRILVKKVVRRAQQLIGGQRAHEKDGEYKVTKDNAKV
jgi:hypothetical protein